MTKPFTAAAVAIILTTLSTHAELKPLPPGVTRMPVVFSGGHETVGVDHGRPVVLIAAALGVKDEVFREAFSHVHPADDIGARHQRRDRESGNFLRQGSGDQRGCLRHHDPAIHSKMKARTGMVADTRRPILPPLPNVRQIRYLPAYVCLHSETRR